MARSLEGKIFSARFGPTLNPDQPTSQLTITCAINWCKMFLRFLFLLIVDDNLPEIRESSYGLFHCQDLLCIFLRTFNFCFITRRG